MARRAPKRPVRAVQALRFKPTDDQRIQLDRALGCTITDEALSEIIAATHSFLMLAEVERKAVPKRLAKERIKKIKLATDRLHALLTRDDRDGELVLFHLGFSFGDLERLRLERLPGLLSVVLFCDQ